jgi:predicted nucleic acid-binding protein
MLVAHFRSADELLMKHALTHGLRTLDALQLATSLAAHAARSLDYFVSSDRRLDGAAAAEGLAVIDPTSAPSNRILQDSP